MDPDSDIALEDERSGADYKVLVVVLGVTGGAHLEGCVASLAAQTHSRPTVAYVGTHEAITRPSARAFGDARVEVDSMAHVGAAANALVGKARPFDVVVYVRDDTVLGSDAIERACSVMAKTGAGVVGAPAGWETSTPASIVRKTATRSGAGTRPFMGRGESSERRTGSPHRRRIGSRS